MVPSNRRIATLQPTMHNPIVAGVALAVLMWIAVPRLAAIVLLVAVAIPAARDVFSLRGLRQATCSFVYAVLGSFTLYLLINALWAEDARAALSIAVVIGCFFACAISGIYFIRDSERYVLRGLGIGLCFGIGLSAAYLLIDIFCSRAIWSAVRIAIIKFTTSGAPDDIGPYGTSQRYVYPYVLNVGIATFSCISFPVLLIGSTWASAAWRRCYLVLSVVLSCIVVFASDHESSKVALVLSGAAFFLFRLAPRFGRALLILGWIAATLFVVPMTQVAYGVGLHKSPFMPLSGRGRIVIWKHTGNKIIEAPLLGIGIGSTAVRARVGHQDGERVPGTDMFLDTSIHAHNVFLQAWFELGAVGAFFLLAIGLSILRYIYKQPEEVQSYLGASFVMASILCGLSFSLFALWWIATIILASICGCLGARIFASFRSPIDP